MAHPSAEETGPCSEGVDPLTGRVVANAVTCPGRLAVGCLSAEDFDYFCSPWAVEVPADPCDSHAEAALAARPDNWVAVDSAGRSEEVAVETHNEDDAADHRGAGVVVICCSRRDPLPGADLPVHPVAGHILLPPC